MSERHSPVCVCVWIYRIYTRVQYIINVNTRKYPRPAGPDVDLSSYMYTVLVAVLSVLTLMVWMTSLNGSFEVRV